MAYFLGIDGGGTKTECVIGDEERVLGSSLGTTIKIKKVGEDAAAQALEAAVQSACHVAQITPHQLTGTCVGIAGSSIPEVVDWTYAVLRQLVSGEIAVVNDALIAHRAAFGNGAGVLVIAGTGSNVLGINERGEIGRAGGWGPMISDEGSGFWIGRKAVAQAMRAHDSGEATRLLEAVMEAWNLKAKEEVVSMANSNPPPDFSSLLPHILRCADTADRLAINILETAADELADLARIVIRKLWSTSEEVAVSVTGGVFVHSEFIRNRFANSLRAGCAGIIVNTQPVHPVMGALSMARNKFGDQAVLLTS